MAVAYSSTLAGKGFEPLVSLLMLFERRRVSFLSAVKGADVTPIGELVRARSASWLDSTSLLYRAAWFNFCGSLPRQDFSGTLLAPNGTQTACVAARVGTGQLATLRGQPRRPVYNC
mgnify:CR=1 FL=1